MERSEHDEKQTAIAFFTACVGNKYGSLEVVPVHSESPDFLEGGSVAVEYKGNLW